MDAYWRHTNEHVLVFESVAYFCAMASFHVNETVRYAFDDDRNAANGGMLEAFNQANAIIRDMWFGFSPEDYALSRLLLYPKEAPLATERFIGVIAASEGRDFPLFPGELARALAENIPSDFPVSAQEDGLCRVIAAELIETTAARLAYYLANRED